MGPRDRLGHVRGLESTAERVSTRQADAKCAVSCGVTEELSLLSMTPSPGAQGCYVKWLLHSAIVPGKLIQGSRAKNSPSSPWRASRKK